MKKNKLITGTNVRRASHVLAQMLRSLFTATLSQSAKATQKIVQETFVAYERNSPTAARFCAWMRTMASGCT